MKKLITSFLILSFVPNLAFSQSRSFTDIQDAARTRLLTEYSFKTELNEVLIPVYLLGSVTQPGLYHVPIGTDLVKLLAVSGGPTAQANIDDIKVRRRNKKDVIEVAMSDYMDEGVPFEVKPEDTIVIPKSSQTFSNNTVTTVAVISGIVGIILSSIIISRELGGNR